MQYLFVFYVEPRYGFLYRSPEPWFNKQLILDNCPGVTIHCSETHILHKYGGFLKNFGLRTSMILETHSESEAMILKLLGNDVVAPVPGSKSRAPKLQMILRDVDWDALEAIGEPLWAHRSSEYKRRGDSRAIASLQKQIDRMVDTVDDLQTSLSEAFVTMSRNFVNSSYDEIDRIKQASKVEASKASAARRLLGKKLHSFAVFLSPQ